MDTYWFQLVEKARAQKMRGELMGAAYLEPVAQKLMPKQACEYGPNKKQFRCSNRIVMLGRGFPGIYLTEREAHVGLLLLRGCTSKETAAQMHLSPRTVEYYIANIKTKLGLRRKSDVVAALLSSDFVRNLNYLTNVMSYDERAALIDPM